MNKSSFIYQCAFAAMGLLGFAATQGFAASQTHDTAKAINNDYTKYVDPFVGNADMATPFLVHAAPLA